MKLQLYHQINAIILHKIDTPLLVQSSDMNMSVLEYMKQTLLKCDREDVPLVRELFIKASKVEFSFRKSTEVVSSIGGKAELKWYVSEIDGYHFQVVLIEEL